eukprot:GEMP01051161.1.p1 GENE.GEMP01051161.1~~GEMP01051161.1.p1  ORF type:complete len:192 (+),score=47.08 GEMP01051161.1:192-767(+)
MLVNKMIVFFATFGLCVQVNAKILRGQVPLDKETDASLTSSAVVCQKWGNPWSCREKRDCAWNNEEKKCEPKTTDDVLKNITPRKKLSQSRKNLDIPIAPKSNVGIDIGDQTKKSDQASQLDTSTLTEIMKSRPRGPANRRAATRPQKQTPAVETRRTPKMQATTENADTRVGTTNKRNAGIWEKSAPDSG